MGVDGIAQFNSRLLTCSISACDIAAWVLIVEVVLEMAGTAGYPDLLQ